MQWPFGVPRLAHDERWTDALVAGLRAMAEAQDANAAAPVPVNVWGFWSLYAEERGWTWLR